MKFANVARDFGKPRFWLRFLTHGLAALGTLAVVVELFDVFQPDELAKSDFPWFRVILVVSIVYGGFRAWPRLVKESFNRPNTEIRIVEGDLFKQSANRVVGMTTTFDTSVPNVVSTGSVQAQMLRNVYHDNIGQLDAELDQVLLQARTTDHTNKPGKTNVYPMGTVAVLQHGRQFHYCLAYTEMDRTNVASTTVANIWLSLDQLWSVVRATSNGDPIAIPVIGGGQAKLSPELPAQDSIRLMMMSFMFASRRAPICERLDIIVRPADVKRLDMLELQAFLASLKDS